MAVGSNKTKTEAVRELLRIFTGRTDNRDELEAVKRRLCKKYGLAAIANSDILKEYRILTSTGRFPALKSLESVLRKRAIRTLSGIAPVAVLTKPYPCPGTCAYCPREKNVPTSYLSNEPAVMRAIRCGYDPYKQVALRLKSLENNGHEPTKIELIVIGGTWSYLPVKYKYWYISNCFKAANDYPKTKKAIKKNLSLAELKKTLKKEQQKNEKTQYKIIGLTLETRPDYINEQELREMRELGGTRVEIGIQAADDKILKLNKRGHGVKEIVAATKLLKEYGFKVTYHLMPALPGATPAKDLALFKKLFTDERFQPDQIKFYPTVVTKGSLLSRWYKQGKYKPYTDKVLQELIVKCKSAVPSYVRIIRLIRDIPGESIIAGNKITNLRQIMKDRGVKCNCIRCREVKDGKIGEYRVNVLKYQASAGTEYFISADSRDGKTLYGFCRLRIDRNSPIAPAIIRELHVYGELVSMGDNQKTGGRKKIQHGGLGKLLLAKAETLARREKTGEMAVISGVGARGYYKKRGYKLKESYLVKRIF
ncbi:MAG: tRNA uridine(34) 5-carboxymethylaminomethyl modification radical SAM/GNAT enzyme Elp3 [Patescibacteria group bacterium]